MTEDVKNHEEVEETLREIRLEQERKKKNGFWRKVGRFFSAPFRLIGTLYSAVKSKIRIPVTVKTTIIFTILFTLALIALDIFIISSVQNELVAQGVNDTEFISSLTVWSIVLIVIAVTVVACVGGLASMSLLAPVRKMIKQIDDIDPSDLSQRIDCVDSQDELRTERGKKHLAQFQYNKLKMQINPHFLFNSLNILDYLVQEGQTERASAFIRKLADSYRYMLKTEDEPLVTLQEEIDFAHKYSELLQERFASGFTVHYQIDDQLLNRSIIPCCLQLLIENATKHNIVSLERPLTIFVCAEGDTLTVRNNIQPRITAQASTGTGLKNIRQQYLDICNRPISVEKTQSEFIVNIPLL